MNHTRYRQHKNYTQWKFPSWFPHAIQYRCPQQNSWPDYNKRNCYRNLNLNRRHKICNLFEGIFNGSQGANKSLVFLVLFCNGTVLSGNFTHLYSGFVHLGFYREWFPDTKVLHVDDISRLSIYTPCSVSCCGVFSLLKYKCA